LRREQSNSPHVPSAVYDPQFAHAGPDADNSISLSGLDTRPRKAGSSNWFVNRRWNAEPGRSGWALHRDGTSSLRPGTGCPRSTLLGGAAAAWPLAARAQQSEGVRRMGVLISLAADDPQSQARVAALLQGLQQFGWAHGRNIRISLLDSAFC